MPLLALTAVLMVGLWSAQGPVGSAAGAPGDIAITGSVAPIVFVDTTGCGAPATSIGDLIPGDPWKTAQDAGGGMCALDFGTANHAPGADLTLFEDPAAAPVPADALKCVSGSCSGDALPDFQNVGEPAAGTAAFGAQLISSSGGATAVWAAQPAVYDVQNTGDTACQTSAVGTGTCSFTWGATAAALQDPGAYQASVQALALAR